MGLDSKGDAGSYRRQTMDDAFWICGCHPNTNPCTGVEETGKEIERYDTSTSSGMTNSKSAVPRYYEIDNASDHHGGNMSFVAMNAFNVDTGSGGVNLNSCGNVSILASGGLANILAPDQIALASNLISFTTKDTLMIEGDTLYISSKKTVFTKNVQFGNNVMINGGCFVNGELYASHITCQSQVNFTGGAMVGEGEGLQVCIPATGIIFTPTIPIEIPVVGEVTTGLGAGGTVIGTATIPALTFPLPLTSMVPGAPIGSTVPHIHTFVGPAMSTCESITDFFEEASKTSEDTPAEAKPTLPGDMTLAELGNKMQKTVTDAVMNWGKKTIGLG